MHIKKIDDILTALAREHLGIETLETRRSDSLDFHDVGVWGVKHALHAAYQAGANDLAGNGAPDATVLREARAEFLMRRVADGDHRALRGLRSAADQALAVIAKLPAA